MSHHEHSHKLTETPQKTLFFCIALNIGITLLQVIGGLLSGSLSLLSDALHNFSDVISLIISYIANLLSGKKFTPKKTFGYKRAEILAAFINSVTLVVVAIFIAKEAFSRMNESVVISGMTVIVLAVLSVVVNGVCAILLRKEASNNLNIKSAYLHLFSDFLSSIVVMLGGVLIYFYQMYWVDAVLSLLIAIYLVYHSWDILFTSIKILMQFTPKNINVATLEKDVSNIKGIINIHHVHIWQLNDNDIHLEAHLDFEEDISLSQLQEKISEVKALLKENFGIGHAVLQPEFEVNDSKSLIADE